MNKFFGASLIVSLLALATNANAQTPKAYENAADEAMESRDYYAAMQYFEKILEMEPNRLDVSYRYADAARQFGAYGQAEALLQKALDSDIKGKFPDVPYRLASVKKNLGKYDEAIRLYRRYTALAAIGSPEREQAERDIEQCLWALEQLTNPDPGILVERMPDGTPNTAQSDFGGAQKGKNFYYSSFREVDWGDKHYPVRPIVKVMESFEGTDGVPASFNDPKRHTAHTAFSPDGKVLVFNKCDYVDAADINCELYFSYETVAGWSEPVKLPESINVPGFTASQPNVRATADGYYELFYSSNCPEGKGGLDLWRVRFSMAGNFSQPENLAALNTPRNDVTPIFHEKHQTLYFSTDGRPNVGGYDIYKSLWGKDKWQEPEHLEVPINSSYDDLYFNPQDDDTAFFTSNREESGTIAADACCYDIYKANYLPLELKTLSFSQLTEDSLTGVLFTLKEVPSENDPTTRFSGEKNEADFSISRQKKYMVIGQKEFYIPDTVYFTTNTIPMDRKFKEKLFLIPEIALAVKTFHEWTKDPLNGVQIRLFEKPGVVADEKNTGATSNESNLNVSGRKQFIVIAEKEGFRSDTAEVTLDELRALVAGSTIYKNLYLTPDNMSAYLPIFLYFDNDQPDPRTRLTSTKQSFDQTIERYMMRREAFIEKYSANLQGIEKDEAMEQLGKFFDEEVYAGYVKLETFAGNLGLFLKGGASINIMVKAFASPLASSDYNLALTERRIASVRNYFRKFDNGVFESYIRSGQLKVSTLPLGESAAAPGVSDDARDKRRSVYSIEASRERRAEILEVLLFKN